MRKKLSLILSLAILMTLLGCSINDDSSSTKQEKAVSNSIAYIKNSSFTSKDLIDTKQISISLATQTTWKSVWDKESPVDEGDVDSTDWIITIGDTSGHDFAIIVCDSESSKVIGYKPID